MKSLSILLPLAAVALVSGIAACTSAPAVESPAHLWADNCQRCHNLRPPDTYDDAGWHLVLAHMRVRAYLTEPEAQAILEFLQAGN